MTASLATLFITPIMFSRLAGLLMLLPLCLAVSVVYKTIKIEELRKVPASVVASWFTIVGGMLAIGVSIYALYSLCA